ncbi:RNA polymerase-associated protein RapA [Gallaecimonas xiamenensis]|uniref:RNA polymerase-associated protein RapA n=1 Tax=Gallaecimonas xiamenensis 3-C-1 TaxID=745411 RepID=K2IZ30_9GAMM|nr:RNA polymerase-associated protein RapA [Gallaecimonas xiamenensis]EKE75731.1 ATP-dependent helicase HepA [Gallaecimonas xiamenensis 3-C-1]
MSLALGQRFIADAESDLGLGTVVALDNRTLSVLFPASGETRLYSRIDAPITRVTFRQGDNVKSHEGWSLTVDSIEEQEGLMTYHGPRQDNGETASLRETFIDGVINLNKPQDRLFAGQLDRTDWFTLRYQTLEQMHHLSQSPLRGLVGARMDLIPHQLYIADDVGNRQAPRVLLADEVGLGKTVEAGMIVHQQLRAGHAERVLLLLPENLMHQWLVEMRRRFNLHFALFDESRLEEAEHDSDNPFDTAQLVMVSLELIAKRKTRFDQLLEADWDMLVVDEAHHLVWEENKASREYQVVEALAESIPSVLLLTATPDQLGHQSHFARLRLLDGERFHDYQAFCEEEAQYKPLAQVAQKLLDNEPLDEGDKAQLAAWGEDLAAQADGSDGDRQQLVRALIDRHGTSRVLLRNTRAAVQGFPGRQLVNLPQVLPTAYATAIRVGKMMAGRKSESEKLEELLNPELIYQAFEGDEGNSWCQHDPRVQWLVKHLKHNNDEKVVLIAHSRRQVQAICDYLREKEGVQAAVFHEDLSIIERDRAAAFFADDEGSQILLCSEIGSEGRNFQFAHQLVLFDLPLNPDLLEQRIGRLDRIGQEMVVKIYVPHLAGTAQEKLVAWYHQGLNAFETTCPVGGAIFESQQQALLAALVSDEEAGMDSLIAEAAERRLALMAEMEAGRDRLLELASQGAGRGEKLAAQIAALDYDPKLPIFLTQVLDVFGVDQEDLDDFTQLLRPGERMLTALPGLEEDGIQTTFDREYALSRDHVQFLSWDHPLVLSSMDAVLTGDMGNASVALLKNKALPAGTTFVELVFVTEHQAPKHLQLDRYLPLTPLRMLLDKTGKDLAPKVPFDNFNRQLTPIKRHTAAKLAVASQGLIHGLVQKAEAEVAPSLAGLVAEAKARIDEQVGGELARLKALKAVNDSIRDDELAALEDKAAELNKHVASAALRLDMVRLVVVVND